MLKKILNQLIKPFFPSKKSETQVRLVVGLNQVDKMIPDGWDKRLNAPTKEAEKQIERRCQDIIKKLGKDTKISESNIEYYSALKRYRLLVLLSKIIKNADAGFKLNHIQPADPFELADQDVKTAANEKRKNKTNSSGEEFNYENKVIDSLEELKLSEAEFKLIQDRLRQESKVPPKVAVIGKAGVGKTTTINNLFNAQLKTSPTKVGTTEAQAKEFELSTGGTLTVIDLPGYGRSEEEDRESNKIYQELIPSCDLVLLVIQANTRDFSDDIRIINSLKQWLENKPIPNQ